MATLSLLRGNSATAEYLEETRRQTKDDHFHSSAALSKQPAHNELASVWYECNTPNWDGYDALPVEPLTVMNTYDFIEALPLGTPLPSISAEPDGSIALEWYRHPRWILSVSIHSTRTIYYAALFGVENTRGSMPLFDELPATILNLIQRVQLA